MDCTDLVLLFNLFHFTAPDFTFFAQGPNLTLKSVSKLRSAWVKSTNITQFQIYPTPLKHKNCLPREGLGILLADMISILFSSAVDRAYLIALAKHGSAEHRTSPCLTLITLYELQAQQAHRPHQCQSAVCRVARHFRSWQPNPDARPVQCQSRSPKPAAASQLV